MVEFADIEKNSKGPSLLPEVLFADYDRLSANFDPRGVFPAVALSGGKS